MSWVAPDGIESRVAIVIVHGIGKQGRYQTLDKFVRGFESALPNRLLETKSSRVAFAGSGAHNFVSIAATDGETLMTNPPANAVDCFEAYWQSEVRGVARARGVAMWLANTAMAPLRLWAQVDVHQRSVLGRVNRMLAEFTRLLLTPLVLILIAVGVFFAHEKLDVDTEIAVSASRVLGATIEVVGLLAVFLMLRGGIWNGLLRRSASPASNSEKWWGWASAIGAGAIIACGLIWYLPERRPAVASAELRSYVLAGAIAFVGWIIASLLTSIVGDAAVYLTDDPDSKGSVARTEIRCALQDMITELAKSGMYTAVHIVAHSLGSVIALDTLNKLRIEAYRTVDGDQIVRRLASDPSDHSSQVTANAMSAENAYIKIGTFVTLASPLDHVAYYFRTRVAQDRTVRREILHFRHGLRLRPTGAVPTTDAVRRNQDQYAVDAEPEYIAGPRGLYWLNIHAVGDPIGQELKRYKVDQQERVGTFADYFPPIVSHEGMWKNPEVYDKIVERLAYPTVRTARDAMADEA